jgi:Xaa-Pro aminopeptidase
MRSWRQRQTQRPTLTTESLGIPGERERYAMRRRIVSSKLNTTLLPAMRRYGIDLWIVLCRESHPDPLLPDIGGGWPGVRNAYLFFDNGGDTPEKILIASHEQREHLFADVYDQTLFYGYSKEGLAPHLHEQVHQRDPKRIGINISRTLPMADGLSATLKQYLEEAVGPEYSSRMVSAELLVRDFQATRIPEEFGIYQRLCQWTVAWCAEAFSERVIWPGQTTLDDVNWWMREKAGQLGCPVEFFPGIRVNRQGRPFPTNSTKDVILAGDTVTLDAGLGFDLYRSDYQRIAYVLRPGETEPPDYLQRAHEEALRVRDQVAANMLPGEIGHKVWERSMDWAQAEGYEIMYPAVAGRKGPVTTKQVGIYGHSLGNSTHGIGARTAVNWPAAYGDRVQYPLELNQWYALELSVNIPIPEWNGRAVWVPVEEDVFVTEHGAEYFAPPQNELMVIPA